MKLVSVPTTVVIVSEKNSDSSIRYYYAYLTEDRTVGRESKHTPQHITLFPPFIADNKENVLEIAADTASEFSPFVVEADGHSMFGPEKDIPVILIKPDDILRSVHLALLNKIEQKNIPIQPNQFIGEGYVPHISMKFYHPKLDETRSITIDHIAVMHKDRDVKTVIAKYILGRSK